MYHNGVLTNIDTIPGSLSSNTTVINASGQAAGNWSNGTQNRILYYDGATTIDLGTLGGNYGYSKYINASGNVAGESGDAGFVNRGFYYDGVMNTISLGGYTNVLGLNDANTVIGASIDSFGFQHAFRYSGGVTTDMGTLGGNYSTANYINNAGQIAGNSHTATSDHHGFYWDPINGMVDIGTLGGTYSDARGINSSGHVTGHASNSLGENHAYLYVFGSGIIDLGTLGGGTNTSPVDINDSSQVAGIGYTSLGEQHAFLYTPGFGMIDIGTLGGTYTQVQDLNNAGWVVGYSYLPGNTALHAFLFDGTSIYDLNSLVALAPGWYLENAMFVNNGNQIMAFGTNGSDYHTYLLSPIPEPASLALMVVAIPLIMTRPRRRA